MQTSEYNLRFSLQHKFNQRSSGLSMLVLRYNIKMNLYALWMDLKEICTYVKWHGLLCISVFLGLLLVDFGALFLTEVTFLFIVTSYFFLICCFQFFITIEEKFLLAITSSLILLGKFRPENLCYLFLTVQTSFCLSFQFELCSFSMRYYKVHSEWEKEAEWA